jgi:hypothetical protein
MMAQTIRPGEQEPIGDYRVDREIGQSRPVGHHVLSILNGLLLIILAAVSLALFWVVATLIGFV